MFPSGPAAIPRTLLPPVLLAVSTGNCVIWPLDVMRPMYWFWLGVGFRKLFWVCPQRPLFFFSIKWGFE
jgi:hypothetical protein